MVLLFFKANTFGSREQWNDIYGYHSYLHIFLIARNFKCAKVVYFATVTGASKIAKEY